VVTLATLGKVKANMEDHVVSKVNLKVGAKVTTTESKKNVNFKVKFQW